MMGRAASITVPLVAGPQGVLGLDVAPAAAVGALHGVGREMLALPLLPARTVDEAHDGGILTPRARAYCGPVGRERLFW